MPSDEEELYTTDKMIADAEDLRTKAYASFNTWGTSKESADIFLNEVMPLHFGNLERQLNSLSLKIIMPRRRDVYPNCNLSPGCPINFNTCSTVISVKSDL